MKSKQPLKYTKVKSRTYKGRKYEYHVFVYRRKETRLPGVPGSAEYLTRYTELLQGVEADKAARKANPNKKAPTALPGSIRALVAEFKGHSYFKSLGAKRKEALTGYLDWLVEKWGDFAARSIRPKHGLAIQKVFEDKPATADKIVTAGRMIFDFGIPREYLERNPFDKIPNIYRPGEGYVPWPAFIIKAISTDPHSSEMIRLAAHLHLYTGQRIQDVVRMQHNHLKAGKIEVASQVKTGHRLLIPAHPKLIEELARVPKNSIFMLYGRNNQPFTPDALRARLRTLQINMGLATKVGEVGQDGPTWDYPYHFHGLRKNAVNALLEAGCTTAQVSSITGQTLQTIEHYAKGRDMAKLAESAMDIAHIDWVDGKD